MCLWLFFAWGNICTQNLKDIWLYLNDSEGCLNEARDGTKQPRFEQDEAAVSNNQDLR